MDSGIIFLGGYCSAVATLAVVVFLGCVISAVVDAWQRKGQQIRELQNVAYDQRKTNESTGERLSGVYGLIAQLGVTTYGLEENVLGLMEDIEPPKVKAKSVRVQARKS